jgi:phosphomannomutase
MRSLVEQADPGELVLLDGLKTVDAHGWTLVLPDPDAPATHIHAEGRTQAEAEQRAKRAGDAIEWILTDGAGGPRSS